MLYELFARPLLFRMDPERVHELVAKRLEEAEQSERVMAFLDRHYAFEDARLKTTVFGIPFDNPIGVAAGFDKNARLTHVLPRLGFGFVEIGTVTSEPQAGNPRPRMFRLPEDQALVNRLGFNNEGAEAVAARLAKAGPAPSPVGINIGKLRSVAKEDAVKDYVHTFEKLYPFGDYFVVNVSSPNTPGLRELQERTHLLALLGSLTERAKELAHVRGAKPKPILVKVAPDLTEESLVDAVHVARESGASGIVATNTTISREGLRTKGSVAQEAGGLSGRPLKERATWFTRRIFEETGGDLPIIGVGGIFTGEDAYERIKAGASLVQLYTGFVYGGPSTAMRVNRELAELLERDGLTVQDAVGTAE